MKNRTAPSQASLCKACGIVTEDVECPLCTAITAKHPDAEMKEDCCVECGKGPFSADDLHLITWGEDPYMQASVLDDEVPDIICVCSKCKKKRDQ